MPRHIAIETGVPVELPEDLLDLVAGGDGGNWDPNGVTSSGSNEALPSFDPDG